MDYDEWFASRFERHRPRCGLWRTGCLARWPRPWTRSGHLAAAEPVRRRWRRVSRRMADYYRGISAALQRADLPSAIRCRLLTYSRAHRR